MKRILLLVLVFLMAFSACVYAESIDLSGMTDDELLALKDRINSELASRGTEATVEGVTVPRGVYLVGEDIPEGYWTITEKEALGIIEWGKELDEYGVSIPINKQIEYAALSRDESVSWNLVSGTYILNKSTVVFTPYQKTDLGF